LRSRIVTSNPGTCDNACYRQLSVGKKSEQVMMPTQLRPSSPLALRIAAGYLLVIGFAGLVWPLLPLGPNHPEFQARTVAYKMGTYTSQVTLSLAYLVAGLGLFSHHPWGRNLALVVLVIGIFYGENEFAWGVSRALSNSPPTRRVHLFSYIAVVAWNGLWFYFVYRLVS
jgi:hypothetical protein